ncbi:pimeloyl-ACP methyl ester carboxylesterase [Caulobacter sp. 1776]
MILIPGLSCSREIWAPTARALARRHRVHLIQVAGFAGAPAAGNAEGAVCAGMAEALADYMAAEGLEAPAVIGHSMGGTIGMMLAARRPDRVGRLMVVDMVPNFAAAALGRGQAPEAIAEKAAEIRRSIESLPLDQFAAQEARTIADRVLTEAARPVLLADDLASDRAVIGRSMEELLVTDLTPELPKITAPTTVLWAWNKASPAPAAVFGGWYQAAYAPLKGAKIVRIDDSAHFIMVDQPARFLTEVETFLAG